ncbi:MAG: family 1 glycosylhydrolase [Candidatus Nanopelagicales bacterium]
MTEPAAFITLNEPSVHTFFGHVAGVHAPGLYDLPRVFSVIHHQLLAHGLAVAAIRSASSAQVGLTNNHSPVIALDLDRRRATSWQPNVWTCSTTGSTWIRSSCAAVREIPVELYGPLADDVIQHGDMDIRRCTDGLPGGELLQPAVGQGSRTGQPAGLRTRRCSRPNTRVPPSTGRWSPMH